MAFRTRRADRQRTYRGLAAVIVLAWAPDLASTPAALVPTLVLRLFWAAFFLVTAQIVPRIGKRRERTLSLGVVLVSATVLLQLAWYTGGSSSWNLLVLAALPLLVVLVEADQPVPAGVAGGCAALGGTAMLLDGGGSVAWPLAWLALVGVNTSWALFSVGRYRRLQASAKRTYLDLASELRERRIAERLVIRRNDELLQIIENLPVGLGLWWGRHFVYVNPTWVRWLGYDSPEEIYALDVLEMSHPDDRVRGARDMAMLGPLRPADYRVFRKDGGLEVFEISTVGQVQFEGRPATLVSAIRLTERRRLEERLVFGERMASLGTLAAGVAHEINNPLAGIAGNVEYVREELAAEGGRPEWLEALEQSLEGVHRVERIVRELNVFAGGGAAGEESVADLRSAISSACTMMEAEIRPRARLEVDVAPLPLVRGNTARLAQVFVQLLSNAVQAIPEGDRERQRIGVRAFSLGEGEVAVEIRDTGEGIAPEQLRRVFDPFWTTRPLGKGKGLGLPICHGIVTEIGGRIEVESTPGEGSVFRVVLREAESV